MKKTLILLGATIILVIGLAVSPVFSINPSEIPPGCYIVDEFDFDESGHIEPWFMVMTNCGPAVIGHQLTFDWENQEYICAYTGSPDNVCFVFQMTNPIGL